MLSDREQQYITDNIWIYDQDWSYYSNFTGEPFLLSNLLVYFDSTMLFICAFPLDGRHRTVCLEDVMTILGRTDLFPTVKALGIWGNFSALPDTIECGQLSFHLISHHKFEDDFTDSAIDLRTFDYERMRSARLARNSAANKRLNCMMKKRDILTSAHIGLIEHWMKTHDISPGHAAFANAVLPFMKQDNVWLVECFKDSELKGFAVLSLIGTNAIVTQGFYKNEPGGRYADGIMVEIISHCMKHDVEMLHLGYSSTNSLCHFKKKWGAHIFGPPFCEDFYSSSDSLEETIYSGHVLWPQRLFFGSTMTKKSI